MGKKKEKKRKQRENGWECREFAFANQPGERANCIFFFNLLERRKFLFYWGKGRVEAGSEVLLMER